jgi:hypothetical protein
MAHRLFSPKNSLLSATTRKKNKRYPKEPNTMIEFIVLPDSDYSFDKLGTEKLLVYNELLGKGRVLIFSTLDDTKALLQEDRIFSGQDN